jgi:hypothetical protein
VDLKILLAGDRPKSVCDRGDIFKKKSIIDLKLKVGRLIFHEHNTCNFDFFVGIHILNNVDRIITAV